MRTSIELNLISMVETVVLVPAMALYVVLGVC